MVWRKHPHLPGKRAWPLVPALLGLAILAAPARPAVAQAIPAALLADLKASTVFVKVSRRHMGWNGSGFVIHNAKGTALVVTNSHVLDPPKIDDSQMPKDKEAMRLIYERQKAISHIASIVTVVFHSGTPEERSVRAEIVARDPLYDLAVLKVPGAPEGVKPIRLNRDKVPETTTLFGLGFPFGRMLGQNRANPTITLTRVELASYKPTAGDATLLQLQGPINPGNSGGPVVDAQGKLCGVQVMTLVNSGFGFAISTETLIRVLQGRLTVWRMLVKRDAAGRYDVEYRVLLIDPLHRIGDLKLYYAPGVAKAQIDPHALAAPLPGAKAIPLNRDGPWAIGRWKMSLAGDGPLVATVQPGWLDGNKKPQLGRPEVVRISVSADTPESLDDGRTFWHYGEEGA
ncbi:MAG TPA: serine protease, partial [Pirellulales bacterium]|nr:serine protease [Pirellulales bacterium]